MLDRTTAVEPSPESLAVFWLTKLFYEGAKKAGQLAGWPEFVNDFETPGDFSLVRAAVAFC